MGSRQAELLAPMGVKLPELRFLLPFCASLPLALAFFEDPAPRSMQPVMKM